MRRTAALVLAALAVSLGTVGTAWAITGGQLDGEIRTGSWFVVDAEPRDPFTGTPDHLWVEVLRRQHDALAFVSTFPADPSLN